MRECLDVHVHVIPPAVVSAIGAGQFPGQVSVVSRDDRKEVVHAAGYRYPLHPAFYDLQALHGEMEAKQTTAAVLSPAPPFLGYELAREDGVAAARMMNDGIAEFVADGNGMLAGLGILPLQDPHAAALELHRVITELGLAGVMIGTEVEGQPLDAPALTPVFDAAALLGAALLIHPAYTGVKAGLEQYYLTNLVGNPLATCVCAARLVFSGTLDRHPDLRVMLVHGGGYLPYQAGRLEHGQHVRPEFAAGEGALRRPFRDYLRRFLYDTLTHDPRSTAFLVDLVGADRVAFGTDTPFDMAGGGLDEQLASIVTREADRDRIAWTNGAAFFGLHEPSP